MLIDVTVLVDKLCGCRPYYLDHRLIAVERQASR